MQRCANKTLFTKRRQAECGPRATAWGPCRGPPQGDWTAGLGASGSPVPGAAGESRAGGAGGNTRQPAVAPGPGGLVRPVCPRAQRNAGPAWSPCGPWVPPVVAPQPREGAAAPRPRRPVRKGRAEPCRLPASPEAPRGWALWSATLRPAGDTSVISVGPHPWVVAPASPPGTPCAPAPSPCLVGTHGTHPVGPPRPCSRHPPLSLGAALRNTSLREEGLPGRGGGEQEGRPLSREERAVATRNPAVRGSEVWAPCPELEGGPRDRARWSPAPSRKALWLQVIAVTRKPAEARPSAGREWCGTGSPTSRRCRRRAPLLSVSRTVPCALRRLTRPQEQPL